MRRACAAKNPARCRADREAGAEQELRPLRTDALDGARTSTCLYTAWPDPAMER